MKKFFRFIIGAFLCFSLTSCGSYSLYYNDDVYLNTEVEVVQSNVDYNIIIQNGTPYYYEGNIVYYIYNNLYYYPYYYDNYWYFRVYRRPYYTRPYPHFRPHHYDYRFNYNYRHPNGWYRYSPNYRRTYPNNRYYPNRPIDRGSNLPPRRSNPTMGGGSRRNYQAPQRRNYGRGR